MHYIIDIIDQKAIRIAIDELYIALDFGYEVFNAKIADAKVKQKLIDDIKKDLHSNDITAEEIWQRLDDILLIILCYVVLLLVLLIKILNDVFEQ